MADSLVLLLVLALVSLGGTSTTPTAPATSTTLSSSPPPPSSSSSSSASPSTPPADAADDATTTAAAAAAATSSAPEPSTAAEATSDDSSSTGAATSTTPRPPTAHRIPTRLEEKLESLSCEIPQLPTESRLWRGNQTHELLLPITVTPDCDSEDPDDALDCAPASLSWEGNAELQSGDVLLVRIDDKRLQQPSTTTTPADRHRQPETAVYQVTRPGHDHCDVTEGVLLDITPLLVDGRKVVTLYDKDLTEGINLLIVVSERWGGQCVRLRVTVKSDNCGENQDCSAKGVCFSNISMEGYECQCCPGFVGPHCEERDACFPSPCKNHGICVDLSQGQGGNSFQCLCPYGLTGKTCETEADPCSSAPCQNGATCLRNATHFRCVCPPGYTGATCHKAMNQCEAKPCKHGICMNGDDGFHCYCQPGYTGLTCEYEYNECESSPCQNGGTCTDHVGYYTCECGRGYAGKRCHVKVDLCDPNPCHDHHYCVDRGNTYSCECPKGFSGPDCLIPSKAACSVSPCRHGGTCWSSEDSFYCACRPGYTGKTCQEEFVLESIPTVLPPSGRDGQLDLEMPIAIHLDHLHNVYIAAGTLACAVIIVVLTVAACHCRVHETYKKCFLAGAPLLPCKVTRMDQFKASSSRLSRGTGSSSCSQHKDRPFPPLDSSEMYYTLDLSDSQSSPLIQ